MATAKAQTKVEVTSVELTLSGEEAKTLVEYLDITADPCGFRLINRSLYDLMHIIKAALR